MMGLEFTIRYMGDQFCAKIGREISGCPAIILASRKGLFVSSKAMHTSFLTVMLIVQNAVKTYKDPTRR